VSDLKKYVERNAKSIRLSNGRTLGNVLTDESQRLKSIIEKYITLHYNSHTPEHYERTYGLINSLRVDNVKQNGNTISARIYFDRGNATNPSLTNHAGQPHTSRLFGF